MSGTDNINTGWKPGEPLFPRRDPLAVEPTETTLAARLIQAKLSGFRREDSSYAYRFRSNEQAANAALNVMVLWMADQGYPSETIRGVVEGRL